MSLFTMSQRTPTCLFIFFSTQDSTEDTQNSATPTKVLGIEYKEICIFAYKVYSSLYWEWEGKSDVYSVVRFPILHSTTLKRGYLCCCFCLTGFILSGWRTQNTPHKYTWWKICVNPVDQWVPSWGRCEIDYVIRECLGTLPGFYAWGCRFMINMPYLFTVKCKSD